VSVLSHWEVLRGLVRALQEVAPDAWREIRALVQEALDGNPARWITPDEWDRKDQQFRAEVTNICNAAGLSLEMPGLRAEAGEILASTPPREPLVMPNAPALHAWRAKWHLADDRSLFMAAVLVEAANATDLFRQHISPEHMAWGTCAAVLGSGLPQASAIPGYKPASTESPEAAVPSPDSEASHFDYSKPNLRFEEASNYRTANLAAFKRQLDAEIAADRAALIAEGVAKVRAKRMPDKHFRWYIRYQVLRQSLGEITKMDPDEVTRDDVSKAVQKVAKRAGMPLRKPKRPGARKKDPASGSELSN
jgi:hypothetical protein